MRTILSGVFASYRSFAASQTVDCVQKARQLPRRTVAAISCGFVLVVVAGTLVGPTLRSVMAEEDSRAEYVRILNAERGHARLRPSAPQPHYVAPVRPVINFLTRFGGLQPAPQALAYAPAQQPIRIGPFSSAPAPRSVIRSAKFDPPSRRVDAGEAASLSRRSVCVRLCDGFHYPVGDYHGEGDNAAHSAVCSGLCPGAPTRLYVVPSGSDNIEDAVSVSDRKPYRSLPVAFRHSTKRDNTCSCRAQEASVVDTVSLLKDFTLRRGDKVMTQNGFRVFRGAASLPYDRKDFSSLANARDLTTKERNSLGAIERASGVKQRPTTAPRISISGSAPMTPVSSQLFTDPSGRSVRLIGPQAMLLQSKIQPQP